MRRSLNPIFLEDISTRVTLDEFLATSGFLTYQTQPKVESTIRELLYDYWESRGLVKIVEEANPKFYTDGLTACTTSTLGTRVISGPTNIYKLRDAIVHIRLNHVEIAENQCVAERFGNRDTFKENMERYGYYFGYDKHTNTFMFDRHAPHFSELFLPLNQEIHHKQEQLAILVSNHLHDKVYSHWMAGIMRMLFEISPVFRNNTNIELVFTYSPMNWQLEILKYYFGTNQPNCRVIDRPTRFSNLLIACIGNDHLLNSSYLNFLSQVRSEVSESAGYKKIFITRDDSSSRRIANQRELNSYLLKSGYYNITLSEYRYDVQIEIIRNATHIIFISGSSGLNLVHAKPSTKIGIITWPGGEIGWKEILHLFGLFNINLCRADNSPNNDVEMNLNVDVKAFQGFMKAME
jgi:hypothetical protein